MAGYRCRVQSTRPSVFRPSLPPNLRSIDEGEREREGGGIFARGDWDASEEIQVVSGKIDLKPWTTVELPSMGEEERGGGRERERERKVEHGRWSMFVESRIATLERYVFFSLGRGGGPGPGPPRCEPPRVGGICASSLFLLPSVPFLASSSLFSSLSYFSFSLSLILPFLLGRVIN